MNPPSDTNAFVRAAAAAAAAAPRRAYPLAEVDAEEDGGEYRAPMNEDGREDERPGAPMGAMLPFAFKDEVSSGMYAERDLPAWVKRVGGAFVLGFNEDGRVAQAYNGGGYIIANMIASHLVWLGSPGPMPAAMRIKDEFSVVVSTEALRKFAPFRSLPGMDVCAINFEEPVAIGSVNDTAHGRKYAHCVFVPDSGAPRGYTWKILGASVNDGEFTVLTVCKNY